MACEHFDWKAYLLGEWPPQERETVERHLEACPECRRELERLRLTLAALEALPELAPPRRLQFVSDKVFEPSVWQRFWNSGPRLGFASAALLALAILAHAFYRPAVPAAPPVDIAAVEQRLLQESDARIQAAVAQAVREAEQRQALHSLALVREAEQRMDRKRQADLMAAEDYFNAIRKQMSTMYLASSDLRSVR